MTYSQSVSSLLSKNVGNTLTNYTTWNSILYNVKKYDAVGNGTADDTAEVSAANVAASVSGGIVMFPPGTYKISSALTFPSNVTLWFANGAKLSIDTGVTVTINGPIDAGLYQIFTGSGTVIGTPLIDKIETAWFGVPITTTSDASTSLQKAITFAQKANIPLSMQEKSDIKLDTQIVIEHGKNASGDQTKNFTLYGNRSIIRPNFNGAAFFIKPLCTTANIGTGYEIARIDISELQFDNYFGLLNGYASASGILIGRSGFRFDGFIQSIVKNILFTGFTVPCLDIISGRMILFQNVIGRSCGVKIQCVTNSEFCGDMSFEGCQFGGTETNRPIHIKGFANVGTRSEVRGISFDDCIVYGSGTYIEASTNTMVGDIWFDSCAWDGPSAPAGQKAIQLYANGTSILSQIFINMPYIVNYTGQAIYSSTDGSGKVEHFQVLGGHIGLINAAGTEAAIRIISTEHAMIHNVSFSEITGTDVINVDGSSAHISIQHNSLQNSTVTYFIGIGSVTDFMVVNNIGIAGVNDASGAVNKLVTNNLTTTV